MSRTRTGLLGAVLCLVVLLSGACSSSDGTPSADVATTSTTAAASASTVGPDADESEDDEDDTAAPADAPCTSDSDYMSGSSTVVFTADGKSPVSTDAITPENTLSLDQGTLTPDTLTVDVGEPFAVTSTEGTGITGIVVGCASGQTTVAGVPSGFVITEAGTYDIVDELADETIGTVTVG